METDAKKMLKQFQQEYVLYKLISSKKQKNDVFFTFLNEIRADIISDDHTAEHENSFHENERLQLGHTRSAKPTARYSHYAGTLLQLTLKINPNSLPTRSRSLILCFSTTHPM